jgi:hypothetical protein
MVKQRDRDIRRSLELLAGRAAATPLSKAMTQRPTWLTKPRSHSSNHPGFTEALKQNKRLATPKGPVGNLRTGAVNELRYRSFISSRRLGCIGFGWRDHNATFHRVTIVPG